MAVRFISCDQAFDVVCQACAGHFVATQFSAEVRVESQSASEVHLKSFDAIAVVIGDDLPFEANVGQLGSGARVGTSVETDFQWDVEVT